MAANPRRLRPPNIELLQKKNAVIYGGGGAIGGAVARAFAREGAKVFLAGRTLAKLDQVAREISAAGGMAETAEVDALDEKAIDKHADAVAANAGVSISRSTPSASFTYRVRRSRSCPFRTTRIRSRRTRERISSRRRLSRGTW